MESEIIDDMYLFKVFRGWHHIKLTSTEVLQDEFTKFIDEV